MDWRRWATSLSIARGGFAVTVVTACVTGFIGLREQLATQPGSRHDTLEVVYCVIQLFALSSDGVSQGGHLPWALQVARFVAPAATAYAFFEAGRQLFAAEIRQRRVRRKRGHVIVCGDSLAAKVLTRTLVSAGGDVVALADDPERGATRVSGDPRSTATFKVAGVSGAAAVYICGDDSAHNLAVALAAANGAASDQLRIYAEMDDVELCHALRARWWSGRGSQRVRLDFFNRDELAARALAREEERALTAEDAYELIVVGTGGFARALVIESARRRWPPILPDGHRPGITLVGEGADRIVGEMTGRFPFLRSACELRASQDAPPVAARAAVGRAAHVRVYLCQDDPREALRLALADTALWQTRPDSVVVCFDDLVGYGAAFDYGEETAMALDGMDGRLRLWGTTNAAFSLGSMDEDLTEMIARSVHERYLARRKAERAAGVEVTGTLSSWEDLPENLREANRYQVRDFGAKLSAMGCTVVLRNDASAPFAFAAEEVEALAEHEHERWSAERRAAGWSYGPVRDDDGRIHPDLVPWESLAEPDREKDREAVRGIALVLADAGFDVVRLRPPQSGTSESVVTAGM
ncbi:RyR domain-containing protein [Streptomyces sp. NPDC087270]|uniref:RyR domain-containing protein n=1 Tax=Streptomyces sp. NPDC087270 TaxID=3365774 RepID=UPI00380165AB